MNFNFPVVLIIYNRPEKTEKVFSVIKKIKPSQLFIIADGPKDSSDKELCDQARTVIDKIDWNVDLKTNLSDYNMGNVPRTITGLNWVFENVDSAIILEDDCVPHLSFFQFCGTLLDYYANDTEVMHISGFNILQQIPKGDPSYFFSNHILPPWGWATWRRAWKKYNPDMDSWQIHKKEIFHNISQEHFKTWTDTFEYLRIHKIGWDIPWNVDIWANRGIGIIPSVNLVENIGFDEQATYTKKKNKFSELTALEMKFPITHPSTREAFFDKDIEAMCIALLKDVST
ncbi:MAG: hypothetical protein A3F72_01030 [Bacteroidetes bacterium RIFCSPLOWO2_12_FULL_35_15]|nr:MAG: hypothetical protein A3F72_01030 [Bacteroidetes bacterium RIFCSPLOWO2_12_FULL_35_15]